MKLIFNISDLDYVSLVEKVLPVVKEKMKDSDGAAAKILMAMPPFAIKTAVKAMPQETRDAVAALLINKYKDAIISAAERYSEDSGVHIHVGDLSVEE